MIQIAYNMINIKVVAEYEYDGYSSRDLSH